MKLNNISFSILIASMLTVMVSCNENVTDFGFDGAIMGNVKDPGGNILSGDITSNALTVQLLGEGDQVSTVIRVKGDGTFGNTKLFPKKYKVWLAGPLASVQDDTLTVDFARTKLETINFVATPYLTVKKPTMAGNATTSSITINYEIIGNEGKTPNLREVYASPVPYPTNSTGSGPFYETKKVSLSENSGTATITGLKSNTKYYIRIGARAGGTSSLNFSDQIIVNTQ